MNRHQRTGMNDARPTSMRTVGDIMEPNVHWLPDDMPVERAAQELVARQITGAPVCARDGSILGVLSIADLLELYGSIGELSVVNDAMTTEVLSVQEDDPLERAVEVMAFEGVHRLLVVDPDGRLAGIVTSMDVLRELAGFSRERARVYAVAPPV